MDFLSKRGGRTQLGALSAPPNDFADEKRGDALNAMELALALEKLNFEKITDLSKVAEKHEDPQFADFIDEMLQVRAPAVLRLHKRQARTVSNCKVAVIPSLPDI